MRSPKKVQLFGRQQENSYLCKKENLSDMLSATQTAAYIYARYAKAFGIEMDEMKLHKLLYFAQRESIVVSRRPIFTEEFEAWRYGPVMVQLRHGFPESLKGFPVPCEDEIKEYGIAMDFVFRHYAPMDSWSLSSLTHGERCWMKAREGVPYWMTCSRKIPTEDIFIDAGRIKYRRAMLKEKFGICD